MEISDPIAEGREEAPKDPWERARVGALALQTTARAKRQSRIGRSLIAVVFRPNVRKIDCYNEGLVTPTRGQGTLSWSRNNAD